MTCKKERGKEKGYYKTINFANYLPGTHKTAFFINS